MLFNSIPFLLLFLPVTLIGYFGLARRSPALAAQWLVLASVAFYAWWDVRYVILLAVSIAFNFRLGMAIVLANQRQDSRRAGLLLAAAVAANLLVLGYYKYANFFLSNVDAVFGGGWPSLHVVLPLGISFFTFTQIAFLADCRRGLVMEFNLAHYALFVTYFPHLIAGPVLHHKEMMPQFARAETYGPRAENFAVGATQFAIGLFKKVILADGISPYVGPVFAAAAQGQHLSLVDANFAALAYAFQLYFDFSGYSDMAIGLSRLFGVTLPANFESPYKAANIIEFWRRWHMTLSRFLRDYLYFPLGGNRKGRLRRHLNLMVTMLLGGLWHGAAWTYVVWGGIHGAMLVLNHGWRELRRRLGQDPMRSSRAGRIAGTLVTFYVVVVAWVFFRADNLSAAWAMVQAMFGANGVIFPEDWRSGLGPLADWLAGAGVAFGPTSAFVVRPPLNWIGWFLAIVWLLPNSQQLLQAYKPVLDTAAIARQPHWLRWRPHAAWATVIALMSWIAVVKIGRVSEFLYFQF